MTSRADKELAKKITQSHCIEWVANPLANPITGNKITYKGPTYNVYEEVCREKFNVRLDGQASELPKLPKEINDIVVPQTQKQWKKNALINRDFDKIIFLITNPKVKFVNEYAFENFLTYAQLCEIGLQYNLVPESDVEKFRDYQEKFTHYSKLENLKGVSLIKTKYIDEIEAYLNQEKIDTSDDLMYQFPGRLLRALDALGNELGSECTELETEILGQGLTDANYNEYVRIVSYVGTITYYKLIFQDTEALVSTWNTVTNPITGSQSYLRLAMRTNRLRDFIAEVKKLDEGRNVDYKSITAKSRTATLPNSISARRVIRQVNIPPEPATIEDSDGTTYKKRTEGPHELHEFSDYIEEVGTDRNSFRHHSILSRIEPLSRESLERFPEKTRVQLLKDLKASCNLMKDAITGKRFDRMSKKNLHLIVEIGPPKHKRCYYVRNIYKYWETLAKTNETFKEPETRRVITDDEKDDIMKKIKYIKKDAVNPANINSVRKDPKARLVVSLDPTHQYYTFNIYRDVGTTVYVLYDLGVIPVDIDLTSVGDGAAYYSSEATVANLIEAFNKGRVMTSNFIPYKCCKIQFKKQTYWTGDEAEIHRKFKLFADEVYGLL